MFRASSVLRNMNNGRWKKMISYSTNQLKPKFLSSEEVIYLNISITETMRKGDLETARKMFDEMPIRTVVSYNTLISGYSRWGKLEEPLNVLSIMHRSYTQLNETTFSSILSVCARRRSFHDGKQIHSLVLKSGSDSFELVGSSLLNFYSSCEEIADARRVFDLLHEKNVLLWSLMLVGYVRCNFLTDALDLFMKMPFRDVIAYTTMISGYSRSEDKCNRALELFRLMRVSGEAKPNEFTFDSVLRAIGRLRFLNDGKIIHGLSIVSGCDSDQSVGGALIELYCNCNIVEDAKNVYDNLTNPGSNSVNSLMEGLVLIGRIAEAEIILNQLDETDTVTYNLMIKGYAMCGRVEDSKRLYREMPERNIVTSNIMISVYCHNGELGEALKLFEVTKGERNTVTWNSMISGYILNDKHEEAIKLYASMQLLQVERSRSTFSTLFRGCSCLGSLQQGQLIHAHVIKTPFEANVYVGTSLVDMYAKCGNITDAKTAFINISSPNVAAWTAVICGCAHQGLSNEAILLFEKMVERGVYPNAVTFVGILLACVHSGLVKEGMKFFHSMDNYGVTPTLEHYTCVVDLLGRSGCLIEAEEFIHVMPTEADGIIWGSLLRSCWSWMDMEVGERVAKKMFSFDPKHISTYVVMSNIYAGVGKWEEVAKVRKKLRGMEVKKDPGCSWIEVKNTVHVFCVEDRAHPYCNEIYAILEGLTVFVNSSFESDAFFCQNEISEMGPH